MSSPSIDSIRISRAASEIVEMPEISSDPLPEKNSKSKKIKKEKSRITKKTDFLDDSIKSEQLSISLQEAIDNIKNQSLQTILITSCLVAMYAIGQTFTYLGTSQNNSNYSTAGLALNLFSSILLGAGTISVSNKQINTTQKKIDKQQKLINSYLNRQVELRSASSSLLSSSEHNLEKGRDLSQHSAFIHSSKNLTQKEIIQHQQIIQSLQNSIGDNKNASRIIIIYLVVLVAIYAVGEAFNYIGIKQTNTTYIGVGLSLTTFASIILGGGAVAVGSNQLYAAHRKIIKNQKRYLNLIGS